MLLGTLTAVLGACGPSSGTGNGTGGSTGAAGAGARGGAAAGGAAGTGASTGGSAPGGAGGAAGASAGSGGASAAGGGGGGLTGAGGTGGTAGRAGATGGGATNGGGSGGDAGGGASGTGGRGGTGGASPIGGRGGASGRGGGAGGASSGTGGASGTGGGGDTSQATIVPDPSWTCGMPDGIPPPTAGTLVFRATLQLGAVHDVGNTQYGRRRIIDVKGGSLTGDRIQASFLTGGLDLELTLSNGSVELEELDILRTSDNALIYMRTCGVAPAGDAVVRVVPDFEVANSSSHAWLNTAKLAGTRALDTVAGTLTLTVYDVSQVAVSATKIKLQDPAGVPNVSWDCVTATGSRGASVFTETVTLGGSLSVGASKRGTRNIIPITGGMTTGRVVGSNPLGRRRLPDRQWWRQAGCAIHAGAEWRRLHPGEKLRSIRCAGAGVRDARRRPLRVPQRERVPQLRPGLRGRRREHHVLRAQVVREAVRRRSPLGAP